MSMVVVVLYGVVLGRLFHALSGSRYFDAAGSMEADHFDSVVDEEMAGDATRTEARPRKTGWDNRKEPKQYRDPHRDRNTGV